MPDDGYRALSVAEVLSDLASLDTEQLLLVKSLEEAGERRAVILSRIDDLLVVQQATHHLHVVPSGDPEPDLPIEPANATKPVSADLLDQMGGLLARDAVRRSSSGMQTAWPLPDPGQLGSAPAEPGAPQPGFWPDDKRGGRKAKGRRSGPPGAPAAAAAPATNSAPSPGGGVIVPTDGRRSRSGRTPKVLALLLIVALLAGGGFVYWKHLHAATTTVHSVTLEPLTALLVKAVPAGFTQQADSVGDTGPSDLAKAVKDDGDPGAQAALVQDGFLRGYQRLWATAGGKQEIVVFLYEFHSPTGAMAYGQRMVAASKANKPVPSAFAVTAIPGAVGLIGGDSSGTTAQIVFAQRNFLVGVVINGDSATGLSALAQQISAAQSGALPAN